MARESGDLDSAESGYREALALLRRDRAAGTPTLANTLRPMALLFEARDLRSQARALWEEARDLYMAADIDDGIAECDAAIRRLGR